MQDVEINGQLVNLTQHARQDAVAGVSTCAATADAKTTSHGASAIVASAPGLFILFKKLSVDILVQKLKKKITYKIEFY